MPEQKSLYRKLAEIMSEVGYIPKNGWNDFHKYNYATESDVQDAVRDKMAKRKLFMYPSITDRSTRETTTNKGRTEYISWVQIEYTITDAESGEQLRFIMEGEGQDAGDKGIYKAITGTQKYAIMKLFMIPTGDDPEATPQADKGSSKTSGGKKQTEAEKKAEDKKFFEARDKVRDRITKLAVEKQSNPKKITDYVIGKTNEIQGKTYKSLNSNNLDLANQIIDKLEAAQQTASNAQQGELLHPRTNQPQ